MQRFIRGTKVKKGKHLDNIETIVNFLHMEEEGKNIDKQRTELYEFLDRQNCNSQKERVYQARGYLVSFLYNKRRK